VKENVPILVWIAVFAFPRVVQHAPRCATSTIESTSCMGAVRVTLMQAPTQMAPPAGMTTLLALPRGRESSSRGKHLTARRAPGLILHLCCGNAPAVPPPRPIATLVSLFALFYFAASSCGSSASTVAPPTELAVDASTDAGTDLSPDAGIDAGAGADAGDVTKMATVVVTRGGEPMAGVAVVFQTAEGDVTKSTSTGLDGRVRSEVSPGDQVTVALPSISGRRLLTYLGVKPLDVIPVLAPFQRPVSTSVPAGLPGNGIPYLVAGSGRCVSEANTGAVTMNESCVAGPLFPLIAYSYEDPDYWFAFTRDVPFTDAGTITAPALGPWAVGTRVTVSLINGASDPIFSLGVVSMGQIAHGVPFRLESLTDPVFDGGEGEADFDVADAYADGLQAEATFWGGQGQVLMFGQRVDAGVTNQTLDFSVGLLPAIESLSADSGVVARPSISWTVAAPLTSAKGGVLLVGWGNENASWTFVVPPDALAVTAPALPADLSSLAPGEAIDPAAGVISFIDDDGIKDYDAFRSVASPLWLTGDARLGPDLPPATRGSGGVVRMTILHPGI
jgi:hypothetical protein